LGKFLCQNKKCKHEFEHHYKPVCPKCGSFYVKWLDYGGDTAGQVVCENEFGKYCVPESSIRNIAANCCMRGLVQEHRTIRFIMDNCSGGDVVHAGAYFGDFLPALSSGVDPGCRVIAFEPCREHYECSVKTLELNDIGNVRLYNRALGEGAGHKMLRTNICGVAEGGRAKILPDGDEEIEVVAIDSIIKSPVSIIHLDVEDYEWQALLGGLVTIEKYKPILVLEDIGNHPLRKMPGNKWFSDTFRPMGYKLHDHIDQNIVFKVG
jgi:FkbM family methyltransferase